jgi:hypothetical protein
VVDPVSGRGYPVPPQRSPRPVSREAFQRGPAAPAPGGYPPAGGPPAAQGGGFEPAYRASYQPAQYPPGQYPQGQYPRDPREAQYDPRDLHAPRHLADAWEGPISLNRPLPSRRHGLQWLLAIPLIPPLLIPLYNRIEPRLLGIPFFYWFQLASVFVAIVIIALVYQLTKGRRPRWPR